MLAFFKAIARMSAWGDAMLGGGRFALRRVYPPRKFYVCSGGDDVRAGSGASLRDSGGLER
jgi:hypothetical protein